MAAGSVTEKRRNREGEFKARRRSVRIRRAYVKHGRLACCGHCLTRFIPENRHHAIYCSRECWQRHKTAWGAFIRLRNAEQRAEHRAAKECTQCGGRFIPVHPAHAMCSTACRRARHTDRWREQNVAGRKCVCCGCDVPTYGDHTTYCSDGCRDRWHRESRKGQKHRRRVRIRRSRGEPFNPIDVFRRDKWRCQRCGCKCRRQFVQGDARSPTLDHIIPIAKGGPHTIGNCQLLCSDCNSRKSDKVGGDQLRLC